MARSTDPTHMARGPRTGRISTVLGSELDYTQIDAMGHQTMVGEAMPWEDLRIEPVTRTTGINAPVFEMWIQDAGGTSRGVYLYSFADVVVAAEKVVFFTMQLPHTWAQNSIYLHVHWIGTPEDVTNSPAAPLWGLEYTWANIGSVYPATQVVYTDVGVNYTESGSDATVTLFKHYISKFSAIAPSASENGVSSVLIGRLWRFSSSASDTYNQAGNKCGLLYIDAHYQMNSLGSNEEYAK